MADDRHILSFPNAGPDGTDARQASAADGDFVFEAPDLDMLPPPDADWAAEDVVAGDGADVDTDPFGANPFGTDHFETDAEHAGAEHAGAENIGEAAPRAQNAPTPWAIGSEPSTNVVPFRRPRNKGKLRRRRRSALTRWLVPFAAALAIVGLPSLFVFWLLTAPSFALAQLDVPPASAGRVSPDWVRGALSRDLGYNLWLLDLDALERRLGVHPWLADVGLRKQPPSTLIVELIERRPAALYRTIDGLAWVDDKGRVIEPVDFSRPQQGLDLPVLSGPEHQIASALELLDELERAGAGWAPGLSEIEILGADDFRLYTTALPFPLVVRQGSLASQARHLRALLPRLSASAGTIDAVDLRFARRIIIKLESAEGGRDDEQRA